MNISHPGILEGTGTKESPFVVIETTYSNSTRIQRETVERMYGAGIYPNVHAPDKGGVVTALLGVSLYGDSKTGELTGRKYHESPRGAPSNRDLCETIFFVDEVQAKVWFDLSNVTRYETSPALKEARKGLREMMANHPGTPRLQEEMRKRMGLPPEPRPKGCLGAIALLLLIVVGLILALR